MHQQTMMFGAPATPPPPQHASMGQNSPGAARLPWILVAAGGATAVFFFALLFLVATIAGLDPEFHRLKFLQFFPSVFMKKGLTYTCCILASGGCVAAGIGYSQLKRIYGSASSQLSKLSLYSYIQAGIVLTIMLLMLFVSSRSLYSYHIKTELGIPLFLICSLATLFGLIHFVVKNEWMQMVRIMNWTDNFTNFLNLGYTLAFWSISVAGALTVTFVLSLMDEPHEGFLKFVSIIGMLAYWAALSGGVLWVLGQVKLALRLGNIFSAKQPRRQQPYQQPYQQPMQQPYQQPMQQDHNSTVMFQQPQQQYPQQQYPQQQYPQPQQYQQQQFQQQQQQQQQEYNERLRQQQYEEYRRQQQERMRQMGDDSQETLPYKK